MFGRETMSNVIFVKAETSGNVFSVCLNRHMKVSLIWFCGVWSVYHGIVDFPFFFFQVYRCLL